MMDSMFIHFDNLRSLHNDASVQVPNGLFVDLSRSIKNRRGGTNVGQTSFGYIFLVMNAFMYKYAHYVDIANKTYIQNSDAKEILGYSRTTKSVDRLIKKGGLLEEIGLVESTREFPVHVDIYRDSSGFLISDPTTIGMLESDSDIRKEISRVVRNRNYEIREPLFLHEYRGDLGTLLDYSNTHKITIDEFMGLIFNEDLNNTDMMVYFFIKSLAHGHSKIDISQDRFIRTLGMSTETLYKSLDSLKRNCVVDVDHQGWSTSGNYSSNRYVALFIGGDKLHS